ncbi:MAG TPA: hypothetical protein VEH84_14265 [Alphaproteobacteria bacterium]|nr:hypothetical protein [Alphaproteobacteria bacterium]
MATAALMLLSISFIVSAFWGVASQILHGEQVIAALLEGVGLIIIAMAIFDVGKFLFEEELDRKELRTERESRQTLTKFVTILIIAVALESLVYIFEAGKADLANLVFPTLLLFAVVALLLGLAFYQRVSREAEYVPQKARQASQPAVVVQTGEVTGDGQAKGGAKKG